MAVAYIEYYKTNSSHNAKTGNGPHAKEQWCGDSPQHFSNYGSVLWNFSSCLKHTAISVHVKCIGTSA